MNLDYNAIGIRVREKRVEKGINQEELAHTAGCSATHLSHVETGNTKVSLPTLLDIANSLDTTIDALIIDSLVNPRETIESELVVYTKDCNDREMHIVLETVKSLIVSLRKTRPSLDVKSE